MKYKFYFCERHNNELIEFLKNNNICYSPNIENIEGRLISFSIFSNTHNANTLLTELEKLNVGRPIVSAEFSDAELNEATFLVIHPKKQCIDIINTSEAYEYSCQWTTSVGISKVKHERQKGIFAIKKEPSIKTSTAFWTEDTGCSEIFTDRRVLDLVKKYSLIGFNFEKVINKNGDYSANIFQIKSQSVFTKDCIKLGFGERKIQCHICQKEQFYIDNTYQLHLDDSKIDFQSDFYMTERIFGEGIAYPLYIISQRFYQLLKKHKLAGGLTFVPVIINHQSSDGLTDSKINVQG